MIARGSNVARTRMILPFSIRLQFATDVGMNSLFIYLFTNTGGAGWLTKIVKPFTMGFFSWAGNMTAQLITSAVVWVLLWYICYWLYQRRIFFRI